MPTFRGIGTTVELRAVQEAGFKFGEEVEQYTPTFCALVPIVSVRINLEGSDKQFFAFQASKSGLANLIDALRATQKELNTLEMKAKDYAKPND